jgi:hypothetical protein
MRKENKQATRLSARRAAQGSHAASLALKLMSSYIIFSVFFDCHGNNMP